MKQFATIAIEGTVITCPTCHAHIGKLIKTLYAGYAPGLDLIRFEPGQTPRENAAACRKCGSTYMEGDVHVVDNRRQCDVLLHTGFGWLPRPPANVPPPPRKPIVDPSKVR